MDDPAHPAQTAPREWLDAIEEARADLIAGRTSPWPEAWARLLALNEELDAELAKRRA